MQRPAIMSIITAREYIDLNARPRINRARLQFAGMVRTAFLTIMLARARIMVELRNGSACGLMETYLFSRGAFTRRVRSVSLLKPSANSFGLRRPPDLSALCSAASTPILPANEGLGLEPVPLDCLLNIVATLLDEHARLVRGSAVRNYPVPTATSAAGAVTYLATDHMQDERLPNRRDLYARCYQTGGSGGFSRLQPFDFPCQRRGSKEPRG